MGQYKGNAKTNRDRKSNMKTMTTFDDFIEGFIAVANQADHEYEQLSETFVQSLFRSGLSGQNWACGLLALHIGAANWGVHWEDAEEPEDPAGEEWKGTRQKSGKHILDGGSEYPWGGLGIAHLDSSALYRDTYEAWGEPYPGAKKDEMHFNALIKSPLADKYFEWADELLAKTVFLRWVAEYWISKFWKPC